MKALTIEKRVFNRINKDYPLLRKGLRMYFVHIIILMYQGFTLDSGYDDMTYTEMLNYSYEINTCDEYHNIISDFNNNLSLREQLDYENMFKDYLNKFKKGV